MKRNEFELPPNVIYLCGNSLGPPHRDSLHSLQNNTKKWAEMAVEGHFQPADDAWLDAETKCSQVFLPLLGAKYEDEVVTMGELSANIHLLLAAFYQPDHARGKYRLLIEERAFPSDYVCNLFIYRAVCG